eukprot:7306464-Pyramimonas_sp.AAC.1
MSQCSASPDYKAMNQSRRFPRSHEFSAWYPRITTALPKIASSAYIRYAPCRSTRRCLHVMIRLWPFLIFPQAWLARPMRKPWAMPRA